MNTRRKTIRQPRQLAGEPTGDVAMPGGVEQVQDAGLADNTHLQPLANGSTGSTPQTPRQPAVTGKALESNWVIGWRRDGG